MAEPLGSALLSVYSFAGRMLTPFFPAILDRRAKRGLEDQTRRGERFGVASDAPPHDRVIWVHAASVGETNSVLPLVGRLTEEGWFVVLTTVTVTGAATAARRPPPGARHQFAPVDVKPWVNRFLDHWRPRAALFVESEVWPMITDQLARRRIPHIIVNARMSERSFRRWRFLGRAPRRLFGRIALALSQSEPDARRWAALGVHRAVAVGNLKFDVPPLPVDPAMLEAFRRDLGNRPFWVAASTHPGEEAIIAEAHAALAARLPGLVTAIVPRHPIRGEEVATLVAPMAEKIRLRSRSDGLFSGGGILVADTLGELGLFYRIAGAAFVGGSLAPHGGHNPIEPIDLGCAVIHGPHTENFAPVFAALAAAGGTDQIAGGTDLAAAVERLIDDAEIRRSRVNAASEALRPFHGALERTLTEIWPFLVDGAKPAA